MKKWSESEINLVKENATKGISYKESARLLGRTTKSIRVKMEKMGYKFSDFYQKPISFCRNCGNQILNHGIIFCSRSCSAKFNNILRGKSVESPPHLHMNKQIFEDCFCENCQKQISRHQRCCSRSCRREVGRTHKIAKWLNGELYGMKGKALGLKGFIRDYLLEQANFCCTKCGWNEIHPVTGKCPLEVNHIDGNSANDRPENLEILCPNCHALTSTFRSLNKNSARNRKKDDQAEGIEPT